MQARLAELIRDNLEQATLGTNSKQIYGFSEESRDWEMLQDSRVGREGTPAGAALGVAHAVAALCHSSQPPPGRARRLLQWAAGQSQACISHGKPGFLQRTNTYPVQPQLPDARRCAPRCCRQMAHASAGRPRKVACTISRAEAGVSRMFWGCSSSLAAPSMRRPKAAEARACSCMRQCRCS